MKNEKNQLIENWKMLADQRLLIVRFVELRTEPISILGS